MGADVIAAFGRPPVLTGGTNSLSGEVPGRVADAPGQPLVFFHLWNGAGPGAAGTRRPARAGVPAPRPRRRETRGTCS
jgi:hypothetical protein